MVPLAHSEVLLTYANSYLGTSPISIIQDDTQLSNLSPGHLFHFIPYPNSTCPIGSMSISSDSSLPTIFPHYNPRHHT